MTRLCIRSSFVALSLAILVGAAAPADRAWEASRAPAVVVEPAVRLVRAGKLDGARLKVRELMLAHPDEPEVQQELYWLLGIVRLRMGRFEQAVTAADTLQELLRLDPAQSPLLEDRPIVLRLQALMALQRFAEARRLAEPLVARAEDDPGFLGGFIAV